MKFKLLILIFILSFSLLAEEDLTIVAIGDANVDATKIHFSLKIDSGLNKTAKKLSDELFKLFTNDFAYYKDAFAVTSSVGDDKNKKARFFVELNITKSSKGFSFIEMGCELKSLPENDSLYKVEKTLSMYNLREEGHIITDQIYQKITGKVSIFRSFFIFVSDVVTKRGGDSIKELYRMDFDGHRKKRLTFHRGTVISPEISKNNRYVLYSLVKNQITKKRRVNLYMLDLQTKKTKIISSRKGINSGAVFMPGEKEIALTLSHTGNAEIYSLNLKTRSLRRITKHYGIDVDPSVSKDGTLMAFLSSRPGAAHIYTLDPRGTEKDIIRVSYVGKYNATPRFSPDGSQIAFSSWLDERFDIFRIDSNRKNLVRLTKNFGSNEDPTWSSDGNFIAFSSQRVITRTKAVHNIYIMTKDGDIIGAVTKDFGMCISPRWSN